MQAGFAMVETGLTRAKNAGNIVMKNLMDFSLGSIVFWVIGFGLMFGVSASGFIGTPDFFVQGDYATGEIPSYAFFIFQTMFCATAANDRIRRYGGTDEILVLLHLQHHYQRRHLSDFRPLDLGRRLARRPWLPRFRGLYGGSW